ncbi:MAG: VCBS repeat-containing protein [Rhodospirillaceae bacterium]|jgi:hypothetical protein|nr:VCBS repeat-containing protein [Rhodospirillaceae bacterium]
MRLFLLASVIAVSVAAPVMAWSPSEIGTVAGVRNVVVDVDTGAVKILGGDQPYAIQFDKGAARLVPAKAPRASAPPPDAIPHATVIRGKANIAAAWLSGATNRYDHGVLGDEIEASAVAVRLRDGRTLRYELPRDSVYEDLTPRLYDMDGDGEDEIILVRSDIYGGAAVSILTVGAAGIDVYAESDPIGLSHRWLNPVGAADFDGDGVMEVAAVVTPHLRGELTYYKRVGRQLKRFAAKGGFSTHFIGSRILGMSVVLDANGDGRPDIVAPSLDRETLHAATLAGDGAVKIVRTVRHDSPIVTAIVAHDIDGQGMADIVYGLENGVIVLIRR